METMRFPVDAESAWAKVLQRDQAADGRFVFGVETTGIYCRPSCPARRPARGHVSFFSNAEEARAAGFRPCLRCHPDYARRDKVAVEKALALLSHGGGLRLRDVAEQVGYAPHHFHRLFKRDVGITVAAYSRAMRLEKLKAGLDKAGSVTDAIYTAGYEAPSRAYADIATQLGMTPSAWKKGGEGVTIRWSVVSTSLGPLLVAATDKGLCRISFDEGEDELQKRFPKAHIVRGDDDFAELVKRVAALVDDPVRAEELPIDIPGTAFQQAVWAALRAIPPGETRTYAQIAAAAGRPAAVRAAGTACGDNVLAVLIPCHRVVRGDGSLGGYAYGLERKRTLLARESGE